MLTILRRIPIEEYFAALRAAPLENVPTGEKIFVYQNAHIALRSVWPEEINPSTFYLLQENLDRQYALRAFLLKEHGVDTLALSECIEFQDEFGKQWMLAPPVVEVAEELVVFPQRLDSVPCERELRIKMPELIDGAHRMYIARMRNEACSVVWIVGGLSWENPEYAYPNHWDDVKLYPDMKHVPIKKLYRREGENRYTRLQPIRALGWTGNVGR